MAGVDTFDSARFLTNLSQRPGVYRMYDSNEKLIYVGKAKNLKKRVASYFGGRAKDAKTMALVGNIVRVEVTVTNTETEALLLEHTLIKAHRPRFNVVLRDDKSYPWIYVNTDHDYPRLAFYRGPRRSKGKLFGPYPSAGAVRETLNELQKLFLVRPCRDSFFANRVRPCLQYQINRCSGPCVDLIDKEAYADDVGNAMAFLEGRNRQVIENLAERMEAESTNLEFEKAARLRDQIAKLKRTDSEQVVSGATRVDADVAAQADRGSIHCVALLSIRNGRVMGTQNFFPKAQAGSSKAEIMTAFVGQYYLERTAPPEVIVDTPIDDAGLLGETLTEKQGGKVTIRTRVRSERARWLSMAADNATEGAALRAAGNAGLAAQLQALAQALDLPTVPARLECFDISHTSGEATVASCVVFGAEGPLKSDYRRFNIKAVTEGDDYLAMEEAVRRRYTRVKRGESPLPDLVLIDGGRGQVGRALEVMAELGLADVALIGVAKGRSRRPGAERLFLPDGGSPMKLPPDSPALLLIQNIRDEAHRFAITAHRQRRSRKRFSSALEDIPGLGPKRRRDLLRQFGGMQGIQRAGIEDLVKIRGISRGMAEKIYNQFNPSAAAPINTENGERIGDEV